MKLFIAWIAVSFLLRACDNQKPVDRTIVGAKTSVTAFVDYFPEGRENFPVKVRSVGELEREFGSISSEAGMNVRQFFLNGGTEAWVVRLTGSESTASIIGDSDNQTGFYALDRVDGFNLLCLPRLSNTGQAGTLLTAAGYFCRRHGATLISDVPKSLLSPEDVTSWVAEGGLPESESVALYYPAATIPGHPTAIGVSGDVAGVMARVDSQVGVWQAPAGPANPLRNVSSLERDLSGLEIANLLEERVNPLRSLSTSSQMIWGTRTLSKNPEWKYVQMRRLALYVEQSISQGTQWTALEPNSDSLWSEVSTRVGTFLHGLFLKGALIGSKPEEAYFVKCGRQTTTQQEIDNGVFNIHVGFAALRKSEFIVLTIRRHAAG